MPDSSNSLYTEAWLPGPSNHSFYTRTYSPTGSSPRAAILFVHGFAEHVGRHEPAHKAWAERGVAVFAFDQRGFGQTALGEKRSKDAAYGKTTHRDQLADIEWWLRHMRKEWEDVPLFLAGHSMGGALALAFPTRTSPPPSPEVVSTLSGVIASSPLLTQTVPVSRLLRKAGEAASTVLPWMAFPAKVPSEDLSHDSALNAATDKDPLIKKQGTLRGLADMFNKGEEVLHHGHKHWPKKLPVLILHGTADKVTSQKASEEFFNKLDAEDKKLSLYPGGFHELTNEPDGVKEKFWDECVSWTLEHAQSGSAPLAKL